MTLLDLLEVSGRVSRPISRSRIPRISALEGDFPAAAISRIAECESWRKEIHRPATSTHKWWAKRLGSVFRGILTAAITSNESEALSAYSSTTRLADLLVLDPFAGSGTTLVEAAKLGARVVGWDINPVATLVQRQALQRWDVSELHRAFQLVEKRCRPEIDRVHRTQHGETVLYYFWVAVARCPECCADTRLFSTHVFAQHAYPKRHPSAQIVCPTCLDVFAGRYDFAGGFCSNGHEVSPRGAVSRHIVTCRYGHESRVVDALGGERPRHELYAKLVLGLGGGKHYEGITDFDRDLYQDCVRLLQQRSQHLVLPRGILEEGYNTRQALRWGYTQWRHFFNDRQLYSLGLLAAAVRDLEVGRAEREALAALLSGTLEFNNLFCSFKGEGTGAVRHMFSHHILKPERTPLEAHPWGTPSSSGSFSTLFRSRLIRAHTYKIDPADQLLSKSNKVMRVKGLSLPTEMTIVDAWPPEGLGPGAAYVRTGDSSQMDLPDDSVDLIITDPPYMDNLHYSELADFFHSWLSQMNPFDGYPDAIATTRATGEVQSTSAADFERRIELVWKECARVLKPDGLIAFTFHQARLSGWIALVRALDQAGLVMTAVQPVKGEMSTSVTKSGFEPSNLDAVVVCRLRTQGSTRAKSDTEAVADAAHQLLLKLRAAEITIGAGDVRSVIRGQVLASYTREGWSENVETLAEYADHVAAEYVRRLLPDHVDQRSSPRKRHR